MSKPKRQHRSIWNKRLGRHVCIRCGTVHLNNDKTYRSLKASCDDDLYDDKDEKP